MADAERDSATTSCVDEELKAVLGPDAEPPQSQPAGLRETIEQWMPLKYFVLLLLVIQNSMLVLMMRASRTTEGKKYLTTTAVVMMEATKLVSCFLILYYQHGTWDRVFDLAYKGVIVDKRTTLLMAVPAILYTVQNNVLFLAVSSLRAATYQVLSQTKILTAVLFSIAMLGRRITMLKWGALALLILGVILVQLDAIDHASQVSEEEAANLSPVFGFFCVIFACTTSGFAGVYFEKIVKGLAAPTGGPVVDIPDESNVWIKNIQFAMFGMSLGLLGAFINDYDAIMADGFFQGYNTTVWAVVACQAMGGLVVAVVVKYADTILKGFATSVSIVVSSAISAMFFGAVLSGQFIVGGCLVLSAVYLYSKPDPPAPAPEAKDEDGAESV